MAAVKRQLFIRNIAQGGQASGELSWPLLMPKTVGSLHIDYRIFAFQPKAPIPPNTATQSRSRFITCSKTMPTRKRRSGRRAVPRRRPKPDDGRGP